MLTRATLAVRLVTRVTRVTRVDIPKTLYTFQKIREVWISSDFLKFIYQISIKFWITYTLLHKFFQTVMIFFDQYFSKCLR